MHQKFVNDVAVVTDVTRVTAPICTSFAGWDDSGQLGHCFAPVLVVVEFVTVVTPTRTKSVSRMIGTVGTGVVDVTFVFLVTLLLSSMDGMEESFKGYKG